ncbi:hypothetical protein L596_017962 [Steinernema carpocapsae]|uniref:Uncharacterized protein n=1 Tax=Steinernema carpocapsae TaxID=34508 RepID=A0A4U5N3L9_STECR|nr:hypothetical protein L596_017962 [Steinernema carpocapsae]
MRSCLFMTEGAGLAAGSSRFSFRFAHFVDLRAWIRVDFDALVEELMGSPASSSAAALLVSSRIIENFQNPPPSAKQIFESNVRCFCRSRPDISKFASRSLQLYEIDDFAFASSAGFSRFVRVLRLH